MAIQGNIKFAISASRRSKYESNEGKKTVGTSVKAEKQNIFELHKVLQSGSGRDRLTVSEKGKKKQQRDEYGGFLPLPTYYCGVCSLCMHFHASRRTAVCMHTDDFDSPAVSAKKQDP